jgi:sterol 3beta-glucosyltransferase
VIIPHGNDQFAWGRRVYELGVGSEPIPRKRLTAEKLAAGLQAALAAETRQAADALGGIIRRENGVETAVRVILDTAHYGVDWPQNNDNGASWHSGRPKKRENDAPS